MREALTEEVLAGVAALVGHLPAAIEAAAADLESEDDVVRQKAYALLLKHGLGGNLVPDVNDGKQQPLTVVFPIARGEVEGQKFDAEGEVVTERTCDSCHETKPAEDFVANSQRCRVCFDAMQALVADIERDD